MPALNLLPMREDLWLNPELRGLPNLLLTHGSSNVSDTWMLRRLHVYGVFTDEANQGLMVNAAY